MEFKLLVICLVLALIILGISLLLSPWLRKFLPSRKSSTQIQWLRHQNQALHQEIARLTTILASKSPLEFQNLQPNSQMQPPSESTYRPTGTDFDEWLLWRSQGGQIVDGQGIGELTPDDYAAAGFEQQLPES